MALSHLRLPGFPDSPCEYRACRDVRGVNIVALMALANLLRLALSSFHPPNVSIAADSRAVASRNRHGLSGHSVDPHQSILPVHEIASA